MILPDPNSYMIHIHLCDKSFWLDVTEATPWLLLEVATRGMDRTAFEDLLARYRIVAISVYLTPDAVRPVYIVKDYKIVGDWL